MKRNSYNSLLTKKKFAFTILMVFLVIFVIEWSGRLFLSWRDYRKALVRWDKFNFELNKMVRNDPDIGHFYYTDSKTKLTTDEYSNDYYFINLGVDSLHFRDDGINKDRERKLLAVGDSFVWGLGVELEETFTEQLEKMNLNLDVINAGISGFTPQQYTRVIKRFVKSGIKFDGVLYNFYSGNDISGEYTFRQWSKNIKKFPNLARASYMRNSLISQKAVQFELEKRAEYLTSNNNKSFLESFLNDWFFSFRAAKRLYWFLGGKTDLKRAINPWQGIQTSKKKNSWYIFSIQPKVRGTNGNLITLSSNIINEVAGETLAQGRRDAKAEYELNYPLAIESIVEAKNICDSLHRDFWLVYVPNKAEIYADALCRMIDEPLKTEVHAKMNTLHDDIISTCNSLNIKVIDLSEECIKREKLGEAQLYYNEDNHFNKFGHKLWAEVVMKSGFNS